jgi:outer membrane protein TolC
MKLFRVSLPKCALVLLGTILLGVQAPRCAGQEELPLGTHLAGSMVLTLDQARTLALESNKQLELGRMNIAEKGYVTNAARKDYLPKLLASLTYLHFDDPLGTLVTTRGIILPQSIPVNVVNQDTTLGTIMVVQPITKLISVSAAVDLGIADEAAAVAQLDKGTRELISGVTQAYYGLLATRRIHATLDLQTKALAPLLQANPAPELRLAALDVRKGIAATEQQSAELADLLNQLLGLPQGTALELVESPLPDVGVASAEDAAALALAHNPQVRIAEQDILRAQAGMKVAKADYLPDVYVFGAAASQSAADYIQDEFNMVGAQASWMLFEWGKRRQVVQQRDMQIAMAAKNVEVVRETVQIEARKRFQLFQQAHEGLQIAGEVVAARQDAEKGIQGLPAIMTAKGNTAKAQLDYMQAEVNYRLAHAKLQEVTGQPVESLAGAAYCATAIRSAAPSSAPAAQPQGAKRLPWVR